MTTEQDPHKHALYRPHHGDMTGWRYIEQGERWVEGDEAIMQDDSDTWYPQADYGTWESEICCAGRRRVPAESKPVEQKRYVTVVIEADEMREKAWKDHIAGIVEIREGNALATLDAIEDNMKQAAERVCREGRV